MPFTKGQKKIGGSRKGSKHLFSIDTFKKAYRKDKKAHGDNIFEFFFSQARKDGGPVLIALMRKMLPDMKQVEVIQKYEGGYADMTPAEAAAEMDKATTGEKPDEKEGTNGPVGAHI